MGHGTGDPSLHVPRGTAYDYHGQQGASRTRPALPPANESALEEQQVTMEDVVPIVEVDELSKRYGRTLALNSVSLDVHQNEFFALLGPNGAGKTTLVHMLCTILLPDAGSATIAGFDIVRQPRLARSKLGVVFQEHSLDDRLSAFENLDFHGRVYGVPRRIRRQRIDQLLELVELAEWRNRLVRELSVGMKRRLEIARALVHDSTILFLDEPTVGLDVQTRTRIWNYLEMLRRDRQLTLIVTTHYIEEVEAADRACIIDHGEVLALGSPRALRDEHGVELLRVELRDPETTSAILAQHEEAIITHGAEGITLKSTGDAFVDAFLQRYGSGLRSFTVEKSNLESVFLSLTGREIRNEEIAGRERTRAFGKRGGEHTR